MSDVILKSARSTLSPGVVSPAIAALRDSAIKEMDQAETGKRRVQSLKFDFEREEAAVPEFDDDDNGVARYPGQNSPHIGNGSGGIK